MSDYVDQSSDRLVFIQNFVKVDPIGYDVGYNIEEFAAVRIAIEQVGVTNVVEVQAKINDETNWTTLGSVTGEGTESFDVLTYDAVRFVCSTYDASGKPRLIVSSFY